MKTCQHDPFTKGCTLQLESVTLIGARMRCLVCGKNARMYSANQRFMTLEDVFADSPATPIVESALRKIAT